MIGMNVKHPYRTVQTLTHDSTSLKIVRLMHVEHNKAGKEEVEGKV